MTVGFIGAGNMGGALATAAAKAVGGECLLIADANAEKAAVLAAEIGATVADNATVAAECDYIFLGVKPQMMQAMLTDLKPHLSGKPVLITMAAGLTMAQIEEMAGGDYPIIRIMPNTPVSVGEGVIAFCAENVSEEKEAIFVSLLSEAGLVEKIDEAKIDAASALHGCGPAFAYLFIEALADGAVSCGLPRDTALSFAAKTVKGAAEMVLETGKHPGALKDAVCSPGGSTIQGVRLLETRAFRGAAMDAVITAAGASGALGKK